MDPLSLSALIAGGASLGGGIISGISSWLGGEKQSQSVRDTNAMTLEMSNTAHQREVADLRKAGLNPLLSAKGGGASTPTFQAPTQSGQGISKAGESVGNAMQMATGTVLQYMQGQQQIELQKAQAENAKYQAEKLKTEIPWINKTNEQHIKESMQRVTESSQRTNESAARTATVEAMRQPNVKKIIADTVLTGQKNLTETQKTKQATEAANNARRLYGARADEAVIIAMQAAEYFEQYFGKYEANKISQQEATIKLLNSKNFQQEIRNILDNKYGHMERFGNLYNNPMKILGQGLWMKYEKELPKADVIPQRR